MIYIEKYTGNKTYQAPSGALMTPEVVLRECPACTVFTHIVQTDAAGEMMFALQNLSAMRDQYDIDPVLGEADAIETLQAVLNAPAPEPMPSAEERIAAALEYQNLMSMEDIEA